MKIRQRKHLISVRQLRHVCVTRAWTAFDSGAPLVPLHRETMKILKMIENPSPRNTKVIEAMDRYRRHKVSRAITTLLKHAVVEPCAETGMLVGKIPGIPGAHSQGGTRNELMIHLREVLEMLHESASH